MSYKEVIGAPQVPTEESSGPFRSQLRGSHQKRGEVGRFRDIIRQRGLDPELLLAMSPDERQRIVVELTEVAEQSNMTPEDAAALFRNRADVHNSLAEAFNQAGLAGENSQVTAERLKGEIPESRVN